MTYFAFVMLFVTVIADPVVRTWTLDELNKALEADTVDPQQKPYLEEALNQLVYALYTGENGDLTHVIIPSPDGSPTWTMEELAKAIEEPTTKAQHLPAILEAYRRLKYAQESGNTQYSIEVRIPAIDISTWTLADLNEAIVDPKTNSQLLPYLRTARNKLTTEAEFKNEDKISIVTPVGLVQVYY